MLYSLRHLWSDATVYWASTGDTPPEVTSFLAQVAELVPNFVTVESDVLTDKAINGHPTDVLTNNMRISTAKGEAKWRSSFDCCMANNMQPMYNRMLADDITDVYRGQRTSDVHQSPVKDGQTVLGVTYHYPIGGMSQAEVFAALDRYKAEGLPVPTIYETGLTSTPDCLHCTGWLDENRSDWLRDVHPTAFKHYSIFLDTIRNEASAANRVLFAGDK